MQEALQSGTAAAKKGILTFMVGGEEEAFEKARDLLACMGRNVVHCGSSGNGQATKLCNNMMLAIEMIGTAEAMHVAIRSVARHMCTHTHTHARTGWV